MTIASTAPLPVDDDRFGPFHRADFRADLQAVAGFAANRSRAWAAECEVLARLASQVPRAAWDTRGPTPWTSFLREIAVARRCSDQAAAAEVTVAVALVAVHPHTLGLLHAGLVAQYSARVLVEECLGLPPEAVAAVEGEVAERACRLTPSRIRDAVRKIELRFDGDAAAARAAKATRGRNVSLDPQPDGQASLTLSGPALAVARIYARLSADARAAKRAGDERGIDALRFDGAVDALLSDPPDTTEPLASDGDRPCTRPIRANITLPVTTALGLDNEPGWLDGYGWISAPQCREWLALAELRQICVTAAGQVVDVAGRVVRPESTPEAIRDALVAMLRDPGPISPMTYLAEPRHDPSRRLAEFVDIRDIVCDGPTGRRVRAEHCDHDHEVPYPEGPTAAWNLVNRARRTHVLKHSGWMPLRTSDSTLWFTPGGQLVEIPHERRPPPDLDPDTQVPDPAELHEIDAELVRVTGPDEEQPFSEPPW